MSAMTSPPKTQKEKPHAPPPPRLQPRQTAASAARAARNATNRNLSLQPSQRTSPTRFQLVSSPKKKSPVAPRFAQRADSRTDVKFNRTSENEVSNLQYFESAIQDPDTFVIEASSVVLVNEVSEDNATAQDMEEKGFITPETKRNEEYLNETESDGGSPVPGPTIISRSHAPAACSRPQTPKSLQSSRPHTPCLPSRPTTPSHSQYHPPFSRPNTPQHTTPTVRPKTPILIPVSSPTRVKSPNTTTQPKSPDGDIKSVFSAKQREFHHLKKELDMKQQAVLEAFDNLRGLHERMVQEGGTGGGEGLNLKDLVVFNVGDWTAEEVAQLCRETAGTTATNGAIELINITKPIDDTALTEIDTKVGKVPSCFADLCLQAFTARQEIIDWVKELIGQMDDGRGESLERIARYNAEGLELCETLRELKAHADDAVETITDLSRRACRERSALVAVGETLVREIARLRQDLEARTVIAKEMREIRAENEAAKALEDSRRELDDERAARASMKEKLATAESQLRQSRARIGKMDRQLRESEATISSLTGSVKTLEDQSRQKEVQLEARARKLKESLKTGEVASSQMAHQRDALQAELENLKDQIDNITNSHKTTVQDLHKEIKDMRTALENQRQLFEEETEARKSAEARMLQYENSIEDLRSKNLELESSKFNPELPTEREMDLWAELQATKDTLRMTEDEVTTCKREKVRFLETLTKIAETENKVGMQQKLAAELLSKEEIIGKMQTQLRELTKNIKLNEQKVIQYEQYVRDLQAHNRAVANCQEAPNGISYEDLQQEIMNLRMGLLEAVHRNEELSEVLAQKEQQLEQQDKTSRAQARVIKVREELINMLKNKETEQSRELAALQQDLEHRMKIVDKVNKQIAAKAEEIQELFATLENKQQQIHRLEKIVLALEEQQRRAQAQRTRHEEKIAALEHELAAGNRRERKFIFF